jgi:hypothetical protein
VPRITVLTAALHPPNPLFELSDAPQELLIIRSFDVRFPESGSRGARASAALQCVNCGSHAFYILDHLNPVPIRASLLIAKVGSVADRAILRLLWNELEADLLAQIANLAQALE